MASYCEQLRQQGNECFGRSKQEGLAPTAKKSALTSAVKYYNQAKARAHPGEVNEICSCLKNIAVASISHAQLILGSPQTFPKEREMFFYLSRDAVHSSFEAISKGKFVKSEEWIMHMKQFLGDFLESAVICFNDMQMQDRTECFHRICSQFDHIAAIPFRSVGSCYENLARNLFNNGVQEVEEDFRKCLHQMHECYPPLQLAKAWCREPDFLEALNELKDRVVQQQFICESCQAREVADELLKVATHDYEELNVEGLWHCIDKYTESAVLTRELDVEGEAIAYTSIGHVYLNVLRMEVAAKVAFDKAFVLAESLFPRNLSTLEWYKRLSAGKLYFQEKAAREEKARKEAGREHILAELQPELNAIKAASTTAYDLLRYIYAKHPPKNPSETLGSLESNRIKRTLLEALRHYHPDKNGQKGSDQWKVLCEEITKFLTDKYEVLKSC